MKWSVQQLHKLTTKPYHFNVSLDFTAYIKNMEDVYHIGLANVSGMVTKILDDTFEFKYNIKCEITMACSLTLDEVIFNLDDDFTEIYSLFDSDEYFKIEKNTVDLDEMVWTNIVMSLPIRIIRDDAYEILKARGIVLDELNEENL